MSDLFLHSNFVYTSPVPFATTLYNAFRYERIFFMWMQGYFNIHSTCYSLKIYSGSQAMKHYSR